MPKGSSHARFEARMAAPVKIALPRKRGRVPKLVFQVGKPARHPHTRRGRSPGWERFDKLCAKLDKEIDYWTQRKPKKKPIPFDPKWSYMWQEIERRSMLPTPGRFCQDVTAACGSGDGRIVRKRIGVR